MLRHAMLGSLLVLLVALSGCGKKSVSDPDTSAKSSKPAPPPSAVARTPWLVKNPNGTFAIDPNAECADILETALPTFTEPPLTPAIGLRVTQPTPATVAVAPLGISARFSKSTTFDTPPWIRIRGTDAGATLDATRSSEREWESAFAELLDRTLPFAALLAHVGEEPWREAVSVGSTVRLYGLSNSVTDVLRHLQERVDPIAARVACANQRGRYGSKRSSVVIEERPPWQTVRITMPVFYSDYGGDAKVDLYVRPARDTTFVVVFMYADEERAAHRAAIAAALARP